jgi:hypothetical protein
MEKRTRTIGVCVSPDLGTEIKKMADGQTRSMSLQVVHMVKVAKLVIDILGTQDLSRIEEMLKHHKCRRGTSGESPPLGGSHHGGGRLVAL